MYTEGTLWDSLFIAFSFFPFYLKKQRESFFPPLHPPNACDSQGWAMPKPELENPIQMHNRDSSTPAIICYLPRCALAGSLMQSDATRTRTRHSGMGCLSSTSTAAPKTHLRRDNFCSVGLQGCTETEEYSCKGQRHRKQDGEQRPAEVQK